MGLYDREYIRAQSNQAQTATTQQESAKVSLAVFVKQTYQLFAGSLLAASAGAYIGLGMAPAIQSWYWGLVILELVLLFGLYALKNKPVVNLLVLFGFTFTTGLTLTPLLSGILGLAGGASIVTNALLLTAAAFGGISLFAVNSKRDFSAMGKMLMIALIILVVGSLINIFLGSPLLQLLIAGVGALLFSAFILFDTQNIVRGAYETPIEGAIALYLDVFNLFVSLLQILGIFGREE